MLSKSVYCDKCSREIKVRDDLVTAKLIFEVVPYHEDCYAKDLKGAKTFLLDNQPINGFSGNFGVAFSIFLAVGWLFIKDDMSTWLSVLALIPIGYRLYSYFKYERHIEK